MKQMKYSRQGEKSQTPGGKLPESTRAVVFDLDGTLADTEGLYRRFWVEAAQSLGYPMEDRHALMIRAMAPAYAEPLLKREVCPDFDYHAVRALRRRIMGAWTEEHGIMPKPGAWEALMAAREKGLLISLTTATPLERAERALEQMNLRGFFDALACGDQVPVGKPDPALYRLALQRLSISPAEAVGVEDARTGLLSSRAAGLFTVLIPDQDEPDAETLATCDLALPSLFALRENILALPTRLL